MFVCPPFGAILSGVPITPTSQNVLELPTTKEQLSVALSNSSNELNPESIAAFSIYATLASLLILNTVSSMAFLELTPASKIS